MKLSVTFVRNFFLILSVLLPTAFALSANFEGAFVNKLLLGIGAGLLFASSSLQSLVHLLNGLVFESLILLP